MSGRRERRTYRVRQLPPHVDRHQAVALLARLGHDLGPATNIQIFSLSSSLNPWESRPTKTATVCFRRLPAAFDNDKQEWVLPAQSEFALERDIIVDVHFLDFTALNSPEKHLVDCIGISGLASHPFGSWKNKSHADTEFMWLRDQLPKDLPNIRSIIYGYDTALLMSESFQTVDDVALSLIVKLRSIGRSSPSAKPSIFLAHSLGGIVLKRALVLMANSGDTERKILESIRGIILFGVPSRGMHMSHFLPMVEGYPNESLIKLLSPESSYLSDLDQQFSGIAHLAEVRLISVYETKVTRTTKLSPSGKWERTGPKAILVKPESAIQRGSLTSDILPVDQDHSDIVKFAQDDTNYRGVLIYLHDLCESLDGPRHKETQVQSSFSSWLSIFSKTFRKKQSNVDEDTLKKANIYQLDQRYDLSTATDDVIVKEESYETTAKTMMDSLCNESAGWRFQEIEEAYRATFDWIFENPELEFCAWLQNGSGIYWINGKPGSGKSTLMKHIYQHPRTMEIVAQRDGSRLQVTANFFFHDRGISTQKSFEGLLHSVLYQILCQAPDVQKAVVPTYLEKRPPPGKLWPVGDLELAFTQVLQQDQRPIQLTLFLDALDEYNGSQEVMLRFINLVIKAPSTAATRIQLCFSSRPWAFLNDNLKGYASLEIHKYTKEDIWYYVGAKFEKIPAVLYYSMVKQPETQSMNAVKLEITKRAEGVFLWVKLITDRLINASTESTTAEELMEMVSILPSDLQTLYERMVDRIPTSRRQEAFYMLEIILRSRGQLDLYDFATTVACASHATIEGCLKEMKGASHSPGPPSQINHQYIDQYGAFIEVIGFPSNPRVQFIHQTVKEFVARPGFPQYILRTSHPIIPENGHTFLSRFYISSLISLSSESIDSGGKLERLWQGFADHAYDAETSTGVCQESFLDKISPEALKSVSQALRRVYQLEDVNSVMAVAVIANLRLYVKERISHGFNVNSNPEIPLLHCAVRAAKCSPEDSISKRLDTGTWEKMTEILLENGADMAAVFKGKTAFEELFDSLASWRGMKTRDQYHMFLIIRTFLRNGYDPDSKIAFRPHGFPTTYTCSPLHIAPIDLVQLLLKYRANVNVLDTDGHSPLDIALGQNDALASSLPWLEASQRVMLLVEHEGRVTTASLGRLTMLLPSMKKAPPFSNLEKALRLTKGKDKGAGTNRLPSRTKNEGDPQM
ncbi:hypothetical protein BDR22DRAFT_862434 [Usnea florida]